MKKLSIMFLFLALLIVLPVNTSASAHGTQGKHIAEGYGFVAAVQWDGTVRATGRNEYSQCDTGTWRDVVALDAGFNHILALKKDGTVYATGDNEYGQCDVQDWKNIVMVAASYSSSYGLKKDGTVVVTTFSDNTMANREITLLRDIVWIGDFFGNLYAIDKSGKGYGAGMDDIEIKDALQIDVSAEGIYVMKKDGSVECDITYSEPPSFTDPNKKDWQDIVAIDCSGPTSVGLKRDGTVADDLLHPRYYDRWSDIAEMRDGFGITSDGLVVFAEFNTYSDQAFEEICSWKVMVDKQRAKELGANPSVKGDSIGSNLLIAANGLRLRGQTIEFTEGSKYAVYSGPGNETLRGGDGRALVSTRGPIQVFGVENGWALILYDVSDQKQRIGYIPELTLPKAFADSKRFRLMNLSALADTADVLTDTPVTDDPLYEGAPLCSLKAGQADVLYLGVLNDKWAYVQAVNEQGVTLRGFVPAGAVKRAEVPATKALTVPEGTSMVWTNAAKEHHYYGITKNYFVVPDDAIVIRIPDTMTNVKQFEDLHRLRQLTDIEVSKTHPAFQSIDGVLYSKNGSTLCFYPPGRESSELTLPEGTQDTESGCFDYVGKLTSIVLPSTYTEFVPNLSTQESYTVAEGDPVYKAVDGVLFSRDGKELIAYPKARPWDTYIVPEGTVSIGIEAFMAVTQIRRVVLPEGLETIEWNAFSGCEALGCIEFPNTLSYINEGALANCYSLTHVDLPASLRNISRAAFAWSGLDGELHIPEGVEYLSSIIVWGTAVSDLYLPTSLTAWEPDYDDKDLIIHAPKGSWAEQYAKEQGFWVVTEEP